MSYQQDDFESDSSESQDDEISRFSRVVDVNWGPEEDWDDRDGNAEAKALLDKAKLHVVSADAMRKYAKELQQKATSDTLAGVPHALATITMVYDYSQNMQIPSFLDQQPGKTYYCVPKNVFCFGCANLSVSPVVMAAYAYCEETGNKGGNNVASLVLHDLGRRGYLSSETPGKEYNQLFDNCGGQNKNRMVLRLALYLVEAGFFDKVLILFYIKGHTKNACDRLFNEMKREYRDNNVYTFSQLLNQIDQSPFVQGNSVTEDTFVDVCEMLDSFYKQIAPGTINKNHMFWVEKSAPTTLHMKEWTQGLASSQNLLLGTDSMEERREAMRSYAFKRLKPPGLSELKQVDLYLKYRPFIPPEHQDDICPRPSDEIMEKVKKDRNEKQRGKAADKRALQNEAKAASKAKSDEEKTAKKAKVAAEKAAKESAKELKAQQKIKAAEDKAAKEAAKQVKAQEKTRAAEEKAKKAAAKKDEREKKAAATSVSAAAVALALDNNKRSHPSGESVLDNRERSHPSEENVEASALDNRAQEEDWPMALDNRAQEEDWPILLDDVRICCCGDNCKNQSEEEEPEYFCHTCGKYSHYMCSSLINGVCTCNRCALGI